MSDNLKQSLNDKIKMLDERVEWFYSDDFKIDDAVPRYKEAIELARDVEKDLKELKNEIEFLSEDFSK